MKASGPFPPGGRRIEFVFSVRPTATTGTPAGVLVGDAALARLGGARARQLSSTERYAVAKMALFQAFDERPTPAHMKDQVRVRHADVEAISETLDL